jgi:hypothetical protein
LPVIVTWERRRPLQDKTIRLSENRFILLAFSKDLPALGYATNASPIASGTDARILPWLVDLCVPVLSSPFVWEKRRSATARDEPGGASKRANCSSVLQNGAMWGKVAH